MRIKRVIKIKALSLMCLSLAFCTNNPNIVIDKDIDIDQNTDPDLDPDPDPCENPPCDNDSTAKNDNVNILYIMTDQQSHYMIAEISRNLSGQYANNPYIKTPNLDKLVKSGYSFANAYCANAVSVPSRFALLTGESPNKYGNTGNVTASEPGRSLMRTVISERSMGQLFKKAGFNTFYGGKVHLPLSANGVNVNQPPTLYGFDFYLTDDDRDVLAQKGADFFSTYDDKKPFLLFLSFMNPHDICMAQLLWGNQTSFPDADEMEQRARVNQLNWRDVYKTVPASNWDIDGIMATLPVNFASTDKFPINNLESVNSAYNSIPRKRAAIWFYYKLMEQVDAEIGKVLDALENSRYKDNTVIVFTSDHGEMAISHNLTAKNLPYEECQKVPLIFAGNGVRKGVIDTKTPVSSGWDMLPTMLDLMGLPIPTELQGISLAKKISIGEEINRRYIYMETVNTFGVVEDGRYKYTRFYNRIPGGGNSPYTLTPGQTEAMFDLQNDPGELFNLADQAASSAKKAQLRSALQEELTKRGINATI